MLGQSHNIVILFLSLDTMEMALAAVFQFAYLLHRERIHNLSTNIADKILQADNIHQKMKSYRNSTCQLTHIYTNSRDDTFNN